MNSLFRDRCFHDHTYSQIMTPHIYCKVRAYSLRGIVTTAFGPLSHPPSRCGFRLKEIRFCIKRCITHKRRTHVHLCDSGDNTTSASVKLILTQVVKRTDGTHGKSLYFGNISKASSKNLRKQSIYRREQMFLPLDFHRSMTSFLVFTCRLVLYMQESEEDRRLLSDCSRI